MVGWHHWLDGHEFEQAKGVDGQRSLAYCMQYMGSPRFGHNWESELNQMLGCWGIFWHLGIWHLAVSVAAAKFHLETPAWNYGHSPSGGLRALGLCSTSSALGPGSALRAVVWVLGLPVPGEVSLQASLPCLTWNCQLPLSLIHTHSSSTSCYKKYFQCTTFSVGCIKRQNGSSQW